jgi:uncharacterized DUF497 family protein
LALAAVPELYRFGLWPNKAKAPFLIANDFNRVRSIKEFVNKIFRFYGIDFEWNEVKYAVNLRNHGVRFEEAAEVFFDPENRSGNASVGNERREYVVGYSLSQCMLLVFVERRVRTRIISARRATAWEEGSMKNKEEVITEEGFALKFYPSETETVSINISVETVEVLKKKAKERDLSLESLLKFYIGQGLRQDMSEEEARNLALKRMASRKGSKGNADIDLAA